MKKASCLFFISIAVAFTAVAQSYSFETLKNKFSGIEGVNNVTVPGFLARTVLWIAGEHEFTRAINEIKSVRLITIPKSAFGGEGVSVKGFTKVLAKDGFEQLALVQEKNHYVRIYLRPHEKGSLNHYFVLIENPDEVVAVEIQGYIDPNLLRRQSETLTYQN